MAKMIPAIISEESAKKSPAEAKIFGWLKNMVWGNAIVLHSLPLKDHIKKSFGEIDFVVICEEGIICLEVKGGGIERKGGKWGFTNRNGETSWKDEGPYAQVQGNMKSLKKYLEDHLKTGDEVLNCRWACCVLTPDCNIKTDDDVEIIPEITFNSNMQEKDLSALFERSFRYWKQEKHFGGNEGLNAKARERLATFLRGDFCFVPPMSVMLKQSEEQLLSVTEEQLAIISAMSSNDRMMVEGAAGTGKTLLAAEQCRRAAALGERVLYLCFNHAIAEYVREVFEKEDNNGLVEVYRYHELLMKCCNISEVPKEIDINLFFKDSLPEMFIKQIENNIDFMKYDRIIIDEGQDLMNTSSFLCINEMIEGGWDNGKWTLYYDPKQNLFSDNYEFGEILKELKKQYFIFPLTVNCRNTKQIAQSNYAVTHVNKPIIMRAEGLDVEYISYKDKKEEARLLFEEIRKLKSEGISKQDIVILSQYRIDNHECCLCGVDLPSDIGSIKVNQIANFADCKQIRFYTVQSFKGLESKAVIMIDVDNFADDSKRFMNYVGMSRARTYLAFMYDRKLSEERQRRLLESLIN